MKKYLEEDAEKLLSMIDDYVIAECTSSGSTSPRTNRVELVRSELIKIVNKEIAETGWY